MAKKTVDSAPEGLREINTDGLVSDNGKPWDFGFDPELKGVLLNSERKQVKGFDGGPPKMKCIARVEVTNTATGEPEVYAAFLPESYWRILGARGMTGKTIAIRREGEAFDTRYRIFA